jgi:phage tail-like protein
VNKRKMATTAVATKIEPYRNFRFQIFFDKSQPVALVSKISALKRTTEVVEWRQGGQPNTPMRLIGKSKYEAINIEQGLSLDKDFDEWAGQVNQFGETNLPKDKESIRKTITIKVLDLDDKPVLEYEIYRCWVSEYTAVPDLDANANVVAIKTIKIENEGWIRKQ